MNFSANNKQWRNFRSVENLPLRTQNKLNLLLWVSRPYIMQATKHEVLWNKCIAYWFSVASITETKNLQGLDISAWLLGSFHSWVSSDPHPLQCITYTRLPNYKTCAVKKASNVKLEQTVVEVSKKIYEISVVFYIVTEECNWHFLYFCKNVSLS